MAECTPLLRVRLGNTGPRVRIPLSPPLSFSLHAMLLKMIQVFKLVGWLEGSSLILLLGLAMPLKYFFGYPSLVSMVGAAHGALFLIYCALAFWLGFKLNWKITTLLTSLVLSCLPFGTFVFERKFLDDRGSATKK